MGQMETSFTVKVKWDGNLKNGFDVIHIENGAERGAIAVPSNATIEDVVKKLIEAHFKK